MAFWIIASVYVVVCALLVLLILVQSSKGSALSGIFGGGSDTFFGATGAATTLNKLTTGLAVAFLLLAFVLGIVPAPSPRVSGPAPASSAPAPGSATGQAGE